VFDSYYQHQAKSYDSALGGWGKAPKFPRPVIFTGLFQYYYRYKQTKTKESSHALDMCLFTLSQMFKGGMRDHIGGGFHRYSTDKYWHVPHFEKMLYDQAQLPISYLTAYQISNREIYKISVKDILDYVSKKLISPNGGFYSAEDADSLISHEGTAHAEGAYYVWSKSELDKILGNKSPLFCYHYGVEENGNAKLDPHGEFVGKNILFQKYELSETAKHFNLPEDTVQLELTSCRELLYEIREKRPYPFLDDKVITAWNGLMISAFIRASVTLDEPKYTTVALNALQFIKNELYRQGKLIRNYRISASSIEGFADDYAFMITALLDLYEHLGHAESLKMAIELQNTMNNLFYDTDTGDYFTVAKGDPNLIVRMKEEYDGAEPSPTSYTLHNLLRLYHITQNEDYKDKAKKLISTYREQALTHPIIFPHFITAIDMYYNKPIHITLIGSSQDQIRNAVKVIQSKFIPNKIITFADRGESQALLTSLGVDYISVADSQKAPLAQVCQNTTCQLAYSLSELENLLHQPPK